MRVGDCYMLPLVEPLRDGRLDARERSSIEQHLQGCGVCRARQHGLARIAELASALPPAGVTSLEHRRGRMRLLQAAALLEAGPERSTLGGLTAAAIPPRVGWAMPAAAVALATLSLVGASQLRAARAARAAPAAQAPVAAATVIATGPAETPEPAPVVGAAVTMGETPKPPPQVVEMGETPRPPPQAVEMGETPRPPPQVVEMGETPKPSPQAVAMVEPPRPPVTMGETPKPLPHAVLERSLRESFAAGVGSMEQGNFGEAIERLSAFRRSHPSDSRSEDAAFLVIVALQRAGRQEAAAVAAREYLAAYPSGYRRGEARRIAARRE